MGLDVCLEDRVHPRLISFAVGFEPVHDFSIDPQGDRYFPLRHCHGRLHEPLLIENWRRIWIVLNGMLDLSIAQGVAPRPIGLAESAAIWGTFHDTLCAHGYVLSSRK